MSVAWALKGLKESNDLKGKKEKRKWFSLCLEGFTMRFSVHYLSFAWLCLIVILRQYMEFATRVVRIQSLMRRYDIRKTQFKKMELERTFIGAVCAMKLCL